MPAGEVADGGGHEQPPPGPQGRDPDAGREAGAVERIAREVAALAGGTGSRRAPACRRSFRRADDGGELRDEQVGGLPHEHRRRCGEDLGGHRGWLRPRCRQGRRRARRRSTRRGCRARPHRAASRAGGPVRRVAGAGEPQARRAMERRSVPTSLSLPHVGPLPLRQRRPRSGAYRTHVIHDAGSGQARPTQPPAAIMQLQRSCTRRRSSAARGLSGSEILSAPPIRSVDPLGGTLAATPAMAHVLATSGLDRRRVHDGRNVHDPRGARVG